MTQPAETLYERRHGAPQFIGNRVVQLRRPSFDAKPAPDQLTQWACVLELSLLFATVEEAAGRLGVRSERDFVDNRGRVDAFVSAMSRLDVARVLEENKRVVDAIARLTRGREPSSTPASVDLPRLAGATQSLLVQCPIRYLENLGQGHGFLELSHRCRLAYDGLRAFVMRNSHPEDESLSAAGRAYAEGRLSVHEVAAVLALSIPDAVFLLEERGFRRCPDQLRMPEAHLRTKLDAIRQDRLARAGSFPERPDLVARDVIASQRIEDIDARPWLRP